MQGPSRDCKSWTRRDAPASNYRNATQFLPYDQTGRRIPSLRMRAWSVVRFMPRTTAAPLGPAMRHCVCFSARRMCWRSASSSVEMEEVAEVKEGNEVKEEGSRPEDVRGREGGF